MAAELKDSYDALQQMNRPWKSGAGTYPRVADAIATCAWSWTTSQGFLGLDSGCWRKNVRDCDRWFGSYGARKFADYIAKVDVCTPPASPWAMSLDRGHPSRELCIERWPARLRYDGASFAVPTSQS